VELKPDSGSVDIPYRGRIKPIGSSHRGQITTESLLAALERIRSRAG
jgi:hypothetical protein